MINRIWNYIFNLKPVVLLTNLTKRLIIPGFEGLPLYNVLTFFSKGIMEGAIKLRASSMAFSFFLAVFPLVIFLFTLIPYIPIDNFQAELLLLLKGVIPNAAYKTVQDTLEEIITRQNSGLLSFGFIGALYFSTNGFNAMINAFNQSYHSVETRSTVMTRVISFILVLILSILLVIAIGLLVFSEIILNKISFLENFESYLIIFGRWVVIFGLFFSFISFIYYLGPASKAGWRFVTAGSTFSTILSIITSIGFAFYVNHFGNYNKLYGSIGTLIVLLLWIYFNSVILLLGFELNASIHNAKSDVPLPPDSLK